MMALRLLRKLFPAWLIVAIVLLSCARLTRTTQPGIQTVPTASPTNKASKPTAIPTTGQAIQATSPSVTQQISQPTVPVVSSGPMKLVTVAHATERSALCNDGSPAVYYFRRGGGESTYTWIIHLQGGGFCYSKESCDQRKRQEPGFMTSKGSPKDRPGDGIQSNSLTQNPDFAYANHVFVSYCSSDVWSGNRAASADTGGWEFRGAAIVSAVIADLMDPSITPTPNLADAQQVLFSGTSAGGAGVLVYLDWLAQKLPSANVRGVNDAGWFIDIAPFDKSLTSIRDQTQTAYSFWNGTVDASCAASNAGTEGRCYLGEYAYPTISTPLFVQISQYDRPQLGALGIRPNPGASGRAFAVDFATAVRNSLVPVKAAFSPAIPGHGLLVNEGFYTLKIQGYTLSQVLGDWYFNRSGPIKEIENP